MLTSCSKAAHRAIAEHRQGLREAKRLLPHQPAEEGAVAAHVRTVGEASSERQAAASPPAGALLLAEAAAERPASAAREALVAHIEERCLSVDVEEWQGAATATGLVRRWLLMQVSLALIESRPPVRAGLPEGGRRNRLFRSRHSRTCTLNILVSVGDAVVADLRKMLVPEYVLMQLKQSQTIMWQLGRVQAEKLEDRRVQNGDLVLHTALGVAATAAVLNQTGVDAIVFSGDGTDEAARSASAGLSWVYDITQSITEAAAGIERAKTEVLPMVRGLAAAGLLSPDAKVRHAL